MQRQIGYWLKGKLYLSVTAQKWSKNALIDLRGPSFQMPKDSGFRRTDYEPSVEEMVNEVENAFEKGLIEVDSMKSDEITFAGAGEPLIRLDDITEAATIIKESRHGVPLRVMTSGLILSKNAFDVATSLKQSGIKHLSVALMTDNPKLYQELVNPTNGASFNDVLSFVAVGVEAGLTVSCSAVERPGVNIGNIRSLALSLGASSFHSYPYFP